MITLSAAFSFRFKYLDLIVKVNSSFLFDVVIYTSSSSANRTPSRSSPNSHCERWSLIHCSSRANPIGSIRQVRTRPDFSVRTRSHSSRICRCCATAVTVMLRGPASFETDSGPCTTYPGLRDGLDLRVRGTSGPYRRLEVFSLEFSREPVIVRLLSPDGREGHASLLRASRLRLAIQGMLPGG